METANNPNNYLKDSSNHPSPETREELIEQRTRAIYEGVKELMEDDWDENQVY